MKKRQQFLAVSFKQISHFLSAQKGQRINILI